MKTTNKASSGKTETNFRVILFHGPCLHLHRLTMSHTYKHTILTFAVMLCIPRQFKKNQVTSTTYTILTVIVPILTTNLLGEDQQMHASTHCMRTYTHNQCLITPAMKTET